jgi:hypothetical protein
MLQEDASIVADVRKCLPNNAQEAVAGVLSEAQRSGLTLVTERINVILGLENSWLGVVK